MYQDMYIPVHACIHRDMCAPGHACTRTYMHLVSSLKSFGIKEPNMSYALITSGGEAISDNQKQILVTPLPSLC